MRTHGHPSRPPWLLLILVLACSALVSLTTAQRGGTPPSTDTLGASCNRYPPRHHPPCLAATQSHLRSDPSGPAAPSANKLPTTSVAKITAFLLKAKPVNAQDASKRSVHVSKRIARAMSDAVQADQDTSSSASTTATALAVMQVLMNTRFAPVLLFDDHEGKPVAHALEVSAQTGQPPVGIDLDAFSAHAIVRTVSGVFTCYDAEAPVAATATGVPTACDMQTLHRLIQLVDVLTAWLDSVRSRAPMAAQLESSGAPTLAQFLAGLEGERDPVTARAIILDLVTASLTASLAPEAASDDDKAKNAATARTLLDVYYLPLHYYSGRRPGHASEREAREAAWRALARVQTFGEAVRKTRTEHPFWFGLMKSGVQWVLGPVAKMMLRGSLEAKVEHAEL